MDPVWLQSYPAGIAATINFNQASSLLDLLEPSFTEFAQRPCFTNMGTSITYQELQILSDHFAAFLQQTLQLRKGDRIALMLPNVLQYPVAIIAAHKAGLVVVNVNPLYTSDELSHQILDSGAQTILVLANFAHVVQQAMLKTPIKHVIVTEVGDLFPKLKQKLVNWAAKHIKHYPNYVLPDSWSFCAGIALGISLPFTRVQTNADDLAFLQYTGGTTGVAKGAMLTHRNIIANILQIAAWLKPSFTEQPFVLITPLPLYHIFSLTCNCLTFIYMGAENILITNPREIKNFIRTLKKQPFNGISGVNTLYNALMIQPAFKTIDFSHLKFAIAGGMALQQTVAEKWQQTTGNNLIEGYGLTETSPVVCINPLNITHYTGSVGLPVPSTEVKIVDEQGHEVPVGTVGELCVRGPQVMPGYWQRPDETSKVLSSDGWLNTGDLATIDAKGWVRVVDRKKDMIIVSGFNVYPNEIEDIIASYPKVLECAVVGVFDKRTSEAVKAFIVKRDTSLTATEIIEFCRTKLTNYKIPKQIEFRDSLPKSNVGKILRRELR